MSDASNTTREKKKKSLRRRLIHTPRRKEAPDDIQEVDQKVRSIYMRRILVVIVLVIAVLVTVKTVEYMESRKEYTSLQTVWESEGGGEDTDYEVFGNNLIRYTSNGLAYLDHSGKAIWDYGYSMKSPMITINGDYGVIGDRNSQTAVIFNKEGVQGTVTTTMPILNLTVSAHGVAALMLDADDASMIQFYDKTGLKLDITVKNVLAETSGYPLDLSLSPTGTGLVLSLVYMDQGSMQSRIAFLNFDVGKSSSDRVVGLFKGESIFPQVEYLSDTAAVAFGDNQINFYSLKNEASPEIIKAITCESEVQSVFTGDGLVGVVLNGENGLYQLRVYDSTGELQIARDIPFDYKKAEFSGEYLFFYNSSECLILNQDGKVKYEGVLDGGATKLFFLSKTTFLQFGSQYTKEMKLR